MGRIRCGDEEGPGDPETGWFFNLLNKTGLIDQNHDFSDGAIL